MSVKELAEKIANLFDFNWNDLTEEFQEELLEFVEEECFEDS